MNKTIQVRVIGLDDSDITYHFAPDGDGVWGAINEFYGRMIQDGVIKTAFIKMV